MCLREYRQYNGQKTDVELAIFGTLIVMIHVNRVQFYVSRS